MTYDKLIGILNNLYEYGFSLGFTLIAGVIVYYGFQMAYAREDASKFKTAREQLQIALLGALLIFGTFTVIETLKYIADMLTK